MLIERNPMFSLGVHSISADLRGVISLKFPKEQTVNSLVPILDAPSLILGKKEIRSHLGSVIIKKKMLKHSS